MPKRSAIWFVAHYADHDETLERMKRVVQLHSETGAPIWLFASPTFQTGRALENILRDQLLAQGVPESAVYVSKDFGSFECLDTVQETEAVLETAEAQELSLLYCVSNPLQLLQIRGIARGASSHINYVSTPLRDRRWWYVGTRLALIPLAHMGIGSRFPPLQLVRYGRANWNFFKI